MEEKAKSVPTTTLFQTTEETRLAEELGRVLAATGRFSAGQLDVLVSEEVVKLRGRVRSYYQKQVAQSAAMIVIGARQLVNELDVA